jgi:uncharacterized protein YukJ
MSIPHYGVLKARPIDRRLGAGQTPHYQIRAVAGAEHYRIAINVKSRQSPSELLYLVDERFEHPITDFLADIGEGFHELNHTPTGGALDFIRGNLFDPFKMVPLPHDVPGPDNDLNEKFDGLVQRALADETALIFAYGGPWGPEQQADRYFGFRPGRGVHEVHMNQGNSQQFRESDGVWNDGGLIFHFPEQQQWVAVFTAFQSQNWHTDDVTGHALPKPPDQPGDGEGPNIPTPGNLPTEDLPDGLVRIVAALVNSVQSPEREFVTLLNTSNREIDLAGWKLADKQKEKMSLSGKVSAGATLRLEVQKPMALSNKGGIITLLDTQGRKVHGVSYTKKQAQAAGWTLAF